MTSPFTRRALLIGALPAAALGLSACGSSQASSTASASGSASRSARAASGQTATGAATAPGGGSCHFGVNAWFLPFSGAPYAKSTAPVKGCSAFALFAYSRWGLILRTLRARMTRPYWRWAIPRE